MALAFGLLVPFPAAICDTAGSGLKLRTPAGPAHARTIQALVDEAARTALEKFKDKGFKPENLSLTLIDLRDAGHPLVPAFAETSASIPPVW
jgi:hypothetical protein